MNHSNVKLSCNDFTSKSAVIYSNWLCENQFKDFTLATQDGYLVGAHKIILSAQSSFFRDLFQSSHQPFQCFEDVSSKILESVVSFMYLGKVEIDKGFLDDFLRFARFLGVKEFFENTDVNINKEMPCTMDTVIENTSLELNVEQIKPPEDIDCLMDMIESYLPSGKYETSSAMLEPNENKSFEDSTRLINDYPDAVIKKASAASDVEQSESVGISQDSNIFPIGEEMYSAMTTKLYTCDLCDFDTTIRRKFYHHKRKIHQCLEFYCDQCGFMSISPEVLKYHQQSKHEMVRYPCIQCTYKATSTTILKVHVKNMHERIPLPCDNCKFVAETVSSLKNHKEDKHGETIHSCVKCDYQTKIKSYMSVHMNSKHSNRLFDCKVCGYTTRTKSSLSRHKKSTHEGIRYECKVEQCEYKATQKFHLDNHQKSQHEGIKYYCDEENCEYICAQKTNLKHHKEQKHDMNPSQIIECKKCKITFTTRRSLKRHRERARC